MTATFSVKNFERFQHYKDRSPPWIKLYNELLDDYSFGLLPDATKSHLIAIWLLASRSNNNIPLDPVWIAKRISATEKVDLNLLREHGFIELLQTSGNLIAPSPQNDCLEERESRGETEGDISSENSDPPVLEPKHGRKKSSYTDAFEAFWRDYPTDALMSKSKTYEKWRRLSPSDQFAAHAALPGFRAHCKKDLTYRPVHAERFLSQRRFDGFAEAAKATLPDPMLREVWGGKSVPLIEAIGAAKFAAWFADTKFEEGPPVRLKVSKSFAGKWIQEHYGSDLQRIYGDFRIEVAA